MAIVTRTLQNLRQTIAGVNLHDQLTGQTDTGSTTTYMLDSMLQYYPDDHFNGWELTVLSATPASRMVSDFVKTSGRTDFVPALDTVIAASADYELHRKFTYADYNSAINDAIRNVADTAVIDARSDIYATNYDRYEYPIPSTFVYLNDVLYDKQQPIVYHLAGDYSAAVAYSGFIGVDAQDTCRLGMTFKTASDAWIGGVSLPLRMNGTISPAINLVVRLVNTSGLTTASATPSTSVHLTSSSISSGSLDTEFRYYYFSFPNRFLLLANTMYAIELKASTETGVDVSNYIDWAYKTDSYADGHGWKYMGINTTWTTLTAVGVEKDFCFVVHPAGVDADWMSLLNNQWTTTQGSPPLLAITRRDLAEGHRLRIVGYRAPVTLTAETDNCEVNVGFVEAYATAKLCASMIARSDNDPENWALKAKFWDDQTEKFRDRTRTRLSRNVTQVTLQ